MCPFWVPGELPRASCTRALSVRAGRCASLIRFAGTVPPGLDGSAPAKGFPVSGHLPLYMTYASPNPLSPILPDQAGGDGEAAGGFVCQFSKIVTRSLSLGVGHLLL